MTLFGLFIFKGKALESGNSEHVGSLSLFGLHLKVICLGCYIVEDIKVNSFTCCQVLNYETQRCDCLSIYFVWPCDLQGP